MKKVVFVVGPTASGKSALALRWAQVYGGQIINCDSIQCYQSVDIGSAKPSKAERALVRHLLFDYVKEGETLTAGEYSRDFFNCLQALPESETGPIFVVGGTGFYFQAIEKGMYSIGAADLVKIREIEERLAQGEGPEIWSRLYQLDPEAAIKISKQDHYRLARAWEIFESHGKTPTQIRQQFESQRKPFPYPLLKIGLQASREDLLPRVVKRTQQMLQAGWLDEVRDLQARGLAEWAPMKSVGYRECQDYLGSGLRSVESLQGLQDSIVTATLQLAKKQRTWFSRDQEICWQGHDHDHNHNHDHGHDHDHNHNHGHDQLLEKFLGSCFSPGAH